MKDLVSTSTYVYLLDVNKWLSTCSVVYMPNIEKVIECYINANFANGWAQTDADNE